MRLLLLSIRDHDAAAGLTVASAHRKGVQQDHGLTARGQLVAEDTEHERPDISRTMNTKKGDPRNRRRLNN